MNRTNQIILGGVVIVIIGSGIGLAMRHNNPMTPSKSSNTSSKGQSSTSSSNTSVSTSTTNSSSTTNISITTNDSSASQTAITVSKGTHVNLTFKVDSDGVYHGGLQFKSTDPSIDTGGIKPGASKTVSFVADKPFDFTPYWFESGVKKDYLISITVQ
jgi:cytoskeletal protein RodZ